MDLRLLSTKRAKLIHLKPLNLNLNVQNRRFRITKINSSSKLLTTITYKNLYSTSNKSFKFQIIQQLKKEVFFTIFSQTFKTLKTKKKKLGKTVIPIKTQNLFTFHKSVTYFSLQ